MMLTWSTTISEGQGVLDPSMETLAWGRSGDFSVFHCEDIEIKDCQKFYV